MKIRSITTFANPGYPLDEACLRGAGDFIKEARPAFEEAGYQVQTARLATPPFPSYLPDSKPATVVGFAQKLESILPGLGFDYLSIGPATPDVPESYNVIPEVIAETENTFASGVIASPATGVSLPAIKACAEIIQALSTQDPDGFANLYFAALANVPPGAPFLPAAYHDEGPAAFALATEAADLAVKAFYEASTLAEASHNLTKSLETNADRLLQVADSLPLRFGGIDFSLAPFPEIELSLGTAMERLGVPRVGDQGSLSAAAVIANIIDQAVFPHCGFSGMMLPVLEDATLAARAAEGSLTIKDLLLYSAVCGTGLDTVPLPGDASLEQLSALLLDLGTLALRLDKPLTARLMPVPGKQAGDLTSFDFPYFANSRVMALDPISSLGLFGGEESFNIKPR